VCIKSLGCLPKCRGTGAGPALVALALEQILALGYREALMCLMHRDNESRRLDGGSSRAFREYVLYAKDLRRHAP
jgi:L-amino acid N-acyltransferase YncA